MACQKASIHNVHKGIKSFYKVEVMYVYYESLVNVGYIKLLADIAMPCDRFEIFADFRNPFMSDIKFMVETSRVKSII